MFSVWSISAQNSNYLLLDKIENRVGLLKVKLELNRQEEILLAKILYQTTLERSKLNILDKQMEENYSNIISKRNSEIEKALGENRQKIFLLLEEIEFESLEESSLEILQYLELNQTFNDQILEYKLKYILPKLSELNQDFQRGLTIENTFALKQLKLKYYEFSHLLKSDFSKQDLLFSKFLTEDQKKQLMKLMDKFQINIQSNERLSSMREKWRKDQIEIYKEYLTENNITILGKSKDYNSFFKLSEGLFLLHSLMIEPYNSVLYLLNLDNIKNQEDNFAKIIGKYGI